MCPDTLFEAYWTSSVAGLANRFCCIRQYCIRPYLQFEQSQKMLFLLDQGSREKGPSQFMAVQHHVRPLAKHLLHTRVLFAKGSWSVNYLKMRTF